MIAGSCSHAAIYMDDLHTCRSVAQHPALHHFMHDHTVPEVMHGAVSSTFANSRYSLIGVLYEKRHNRLTQA